MLLALALALATFACTAAATDPTGTPIPPGETSPPPHATPTRAGATAAITETGAPPDTAPERDPSGVPDDVIKTATPPATSLASERNSQGKVQLGASGPGLAAKDGPPKAGERGTPPQGRAHTWQDGDRTITVLLQQDLTIDEDGRIIEKTASTNQSGATGLGIRDQEEQSNQAPVFRSHSGTLMTLPGGVMLALDETWTKVQTDAFFALNSIQTSRVSELDYLTNGFFVETDPGFPSLELANNLASQHGVTAASPNWQKQLTIK